MLLMEDASTTIQVECSLGAKSQVGCGTVGPGSATSPIAATMTHNAVFRVVNASPAGALTKGVAVLAAAAAGVLAVLL